MVVDNHDLPLLQKFQIREHQLHLPPLLPALVAVLLLQLVVQASPDFAVETNQFEQALVRPVLPPLVGGFQQVFLLSARLPLVPCVPALVIFVGQRLQFLLGVLQLWLLSSLLASPLFLLVAPVILPKHDLGDLEYFGNDQQFAENPTYSSRKYPLTVARWQLNSYQIVPPKSTFLDKAVRQSYRPLRFASLG